MAYIETLNGFNIAPKDAVRAFATVADMQAATDLAAGMTCHTNGFHEEGDGGAAYYTISTEGTANGMDVLALQNSLYATLVVTEPYVTPEMFGAYGDGTHNDTDCFNRMLVVHPKVKASSTYLLDTITLDSVEYEGGAILANSSVGVIVGNSCTISNVSISKTDYPTISDDSIALHVLGAFNKFEGIDVSKFRYGYYLANEDNAGCVYNEFYDGTVWDCVEHIYLKNIGSGWTNENSFYSVSARNTNAFTAYINALADAADYKALFAVTLYRTANETHDLNMNRFFGCSTERCFNGLRIIGAKNLFIHNHTEGNTCDYKFESASSGDINNTLIAPYDATTASPKIEMESSTQCLVIANTADVKVPYGKLLDFDDSMHSKRNYFKTTSTAIEMYYRDALKLSLQASAGVYFHDKAYNFHTYAAKIASIKAMTDMVNGTMCYATDLHKHVTYYAGTWYDESGTAV